MTLAAAVQNARHTAQLITWSDGDGDPQDLAGATLTGRIVADADGDTRAMDGTLAIVDADAGQFTWTYGTADVADDGTFRVQFVATYGLVNDKTIMERWVVHPEIVIVP